MRPFACGNCRSLVFFENTSCVTCGQELGFDRASAELRPCKEYGACANRELINCNWLAAPGELCDCCALTRTRPNNLDLAGIAAWAAAESAKRRLIFQLDHLGLPTTPRSVDPQGGLAFDLLSSSAEPVITGHDSGTITIDLAEGHDPHREALRVQLAEPYRTLLGHLRHEVGHWYWDVLSRAGRLRGFRDLFGDETADYQEALREHYARPDDRSWAGTHVSHYAAAHPWEDWAETFAHYLHIRDTTQTAQTWGLRIDGPELDLNVAWDAGLSADPHEDTGDFDELVRAWFPLSFALNAVNRSMGKDDLYPFVLAPAVLTKLRFVHDAVAASP